MCNLVHIEGQTHNSCCHCEYLMFSSQWQMPRLAFVFMDIIQAYSQNTHKHSKHQSSTENTFGKQMLLVPTCLKQFAVPCSCDTVYLQGLLDVCGAKKVNAELDWSQLCKIGLVLNGVHQFLRVVH